LQTGVVFPAVNSTKSKLDSSAIDKALSNGTTPQFLPKLSIS